MLILNVIEAVLVNNTNNDIEKNKIMCYNNFK